MENKGSSEKMSQSRGEQGDTIGKCNIIWYPGLDLGTEKN